MLSIMKKLKQVWLSEESEPANYESRLLWAIACTAFFGFLRLGEVFPPTGNCTPPLLLSDLGTDSHLDPTFFRILIRRAKNDPFGKGSSIFLGRTDKDICPTQALKRYLLNRPPGQGGLVPESRWLSMLERSFCPRSLPRPVKGRSQSLALRWAQLQNWSRHNRCHCRHSSPHDQEPGPLVIRCLHAVFHQSDSSLLHNSTVLASTSSC